MTEFETIEERFVRGWSEGAQRRKKVNRLRRLVRGDSSEVTGGPALSEPTETGKRLARMQTDAAPVEDLEGYDPGISLTLLEHLRTLQVRSGVRAPTIETSAREPIERAFIVEYMNALLGGPPNGSGVEDAMSIACWDFLIAGLGWVWPTLEGTRPVVEYVDATRVVYDPYPKKIRQRTWEAMMVVKPLWYWEAMFGEVEMRRAADDWYAAGIGDPDEGMEMVLYWDIQGEQGTECWFPSVWSGKDGRTPLEHRENLYKTEANGHAQPMLPLCPLSLFHLPGGAYPVGMAEMMMGHATMIVGIDRQDRDVVERGKPMVVVEEGTLSPEMIEAIKRNEAGGLIEVKSNKQMPTRWPQLEISQSQIALRRATEERLQAMSGANPYVGGSGPDVDFAAQVGAIEANSGLMEGAVAQAVAKHWEAVIKVMYNLGRLYDSEPLIIRHNDQDLSFGPHERIGRYLDPRVHISVVEDTTRFESRDRRERRALDRLLVTAKFSDAFPEAFRQAYEEYLRAIGYNDVGKLLAPPATAVGTGLAEGQTTISEAVA